MLFRSGGSTKVALFRGTPQAENVGWRRVAFRVSGAAFLEFLDRLDDVPVVSSGGSTVTAGDTVDRDVCWSIYFADPYGNRLEITTYDYAEVAAALSS